MSGESSGDGETVALQNGVQEAIERVDSERRDPTPSQFPDPLELGRQRYIDSRRWGPNGGSTEDPNYREAVRIVCAFPPAHRP